MIIFISIIVSFFLALFLYEKWTIKEMALAYIDLEKIMSSEGFTIFKDVQIKKDANCFKKVEKLATKLKGKRCR